MSDALASDGNELARLRAENARLRSENARLNRDLNEQKRLLWGAPEAVTLKQIEDFKERRGVWAYLARRGKELADRFREPDGTLPRFESVIAMLEHSVATAAEMNLYHNPDLGDEEKAALRGAYTDQLRFLEALNTLPEVRKQQILEVTEKRLMHSPSYQIEATVLACYDELTEVRYDDQAQPMKVGRIGPLQEPQFNSMTMDEAQRLIAGRLPDRTLKAIENMVTRGRKAIGEARSLRGGVKRTRADAKSSAFYFAYHQARSRLRSESGDAVSRVHRLLAQLK